MLDDDDIDSPSERRRIDRVVGFDYSVEVVPQSLHLRQRRQWRERGDEKWRRYVTAELEKAGLEGGESAIAVAAIAVAASWGNEGKGVSCEEEVRKKDRREIESGQGGLAAGSWSWLTMAEDVGFNGGVTSSNPGPE
jgi:hypothetical protein